MLSILSPKDLTEIHLAYFRKHTQNFAVDPHSVYFLLSHDASEPKNNEYFAFAILQMEEKAHLKLIYIEEEERYNLYGTQLIRAILGYCRKHKKDVLYLDLQSLNSYKEAQVFFQRLGFEEEEGLWLKKDILKRRKRFQQTLFALGISVAVNTLLTIMKLTVGYLSGSQGAIADGWQTLLDNLTSFMLFFTSYISYREADREHPFGHANVEPIASLVIGVWLISAAVTLAFKGFLSLWSPQNLDYPILTLIVIALSIFIKGLLYLYKLQVAKRLQDSSLLADALEHRSDVLSSVGVLFGIYLSYLGLPIADALAGLVVAILIIKESYQLVKASVDRLMNRQEESQLKLVRSIVEKSPSVQDVHDIRIKYDGNQLFVLLDVRFPREFSLHQAHEASHKIELEIKKAMDNVEKVFIHTEPTMK